MAAKKSAAKKTVAKKTVAKKTVAEKRAPAKKAASTKGQKRGFPDLVFANASPKSIGGTSMFESPRAATADDAMAFTSDERVTREAVNRLLVAGFQVLGISAQTINIAGPPGLYEDVFGNSLKMEDRDVIKSGQVEDVAQFVDTNDTDLPGLIDTSRSSLSDVLEGVAIEEPVYFMADSAFAPTKEYWHLRVPGDISAGVNAEKAHRRGLTGKGVKVVMVDSGWYRHPYFTRRGYNSSPVVLGPAAANPLADESGHGTGESANLFAVAPDIDFTMVKINFVNSVGAFNAGVALNPDIISNSWGSSVLNPPLSATNQVLAAAVALAWSSGIVVVFSAGNGHIGFPGQHPDVISAGGVYMKQDESLQASSYASGFASNVYPGRNVPDVSGLVGMSPGASYIMLPVEPGDDIDTGRAGGTHPPKDETASNDGWAVFSGTSAAAPQVAGVAALMKQACDRVTPAQIRSIMKSTATDVTVGTNANGNTAGVGYDLATGAGLVDANKASLRARLSCLTIQPPIIIGPPIQPPIGIAPPIQPPIQPPIIIGPPIQPPIQPPIIIGPPIQPPIQPPIIIGPPIQPPIGIRPPIRPPIGIKPPIRPPIGIRPPIRPPIGIGPVIQPPRPRSASDEANDQIAAYVDAMLQAGYSGPEVDEWLTQVTSQQQQSGGLTADEAAALEEAILDGDDFNL